nr:hypothetical protein CFP56_62806 [Quercus suber]
MAGLEEMWARFSLSEEEDRGAEVRGQEEAIVHRLAGKFLTKRVINVEAVARTFKPLWKPGGELKIRDVGDNILIFEFEDSLDLERVLEFEPWSYDKSLVVFQRAVEAESALSLDYSWASFWIQIHNVPDHLLSQETGESVGKTLGKVLRVADPEDDGAGGEFLRVRINLDISRPLPRCCKLWAGQKLVGWVGIKFERLPNFCYWCGRATHSERDCEKWLGSKGTLRKEDQEYGEWMRAETIRSVRKTVVVIPGKSRRQAPWKQQSNDPKHSRSNGTGTSVQVDSNGDQGTASQREGSESDDVEPTQRASPIVEIGQAAKASSEMMHESGLDNVIVGLTISEAEVPQAPRTEFDYQSPMAHAVIAEPLIGSLSPIQQPTIFTKAWKRIAREVGMVTKDEIPENGAGIGENTIKAGRKRMSIDFEDKLENKKFCMDVCKGEEEQNIEEGLLEWNKKYFGHVRNTLARKLRELSHAEEAGCYVTDPRRIFQLREEIQKLKIREESMWKQRSRNSWLKDGDSNTRYFHCRANQRNKRNFITGLENSAGEWVEDEGRMGAAVEEYFRSIFTSSRPTEFEEILQGIHPAITEEGAGCLDREFQADEVDEDSRVSSLIDQDNFTWKVPLVKELFLPHEAELILSINLSSRRPPDRIAWAPTPSDFCYYCVEYLEQKNALIFGRSALPVDQICSSAGNLLQEFLAAQDTETALPNPPSPQRWCPPMTDVCKVNFDAAVFRSSNLAGLGVVVRDSSGAMIGALSAPTPLGSSVAELEALACLRAVQFASEIGLTSRAVHGVARPCLTKPSWNHLLSLRDL